MGKRKMRCEPTSSQCGDGSPKDAGDRPRTRKRKASSSLARPTATKRRAVVDANTTKAEVDSSTTKRAGEAERSRREREIHAVLRGSTSKAEFKAKYKQTYLLGQGGFGSVYAGSRLSDQLPVAIKHVAKKKVVYYSASLPNEGLKVPKEVVLMLKAGGSPSMVGQNPTVSLLDWYDLGQEVVLVMERPDPAVDLYTFLCSIGRSLTEKEAKEILQQLVTAVKELHAKGVFHRDLKTENILIQSVGQGFKVRIIDFGCGCYNSSRLFETFSGTESYAPPELFNEGKYSAAPTSVWQIGTILIELLEAGREFQTKEFLTKKITFKRGLSKGCRDFLESCLQKDPQRRISLEQLEQHPWF